MILWESPRRSGRRSDSVKLIEGGRDRKLDGTVILKRIVKPLLEWYDSHARELPWRQGEADGCNPYHVWISEIMLQQTRVEAVRGYYRRFLDRLPRVADLAAVPEDELMKLWQGLGYYNRARNLQKAAQRIMDEYGGRFPGEYEQILTLPGIGEYTAGAIASIAFGRAVPAVDGNVYRIYTRLFCDGSDITKTAVRRRIRKELLEIIPQERPGSFNQAWMDLGAVICLPNGEPLCGQCPLADFCLSGKNKNWQDYPVKPAKKKRRQEERTVILLEYRGKYLLQKRPARGLLAGLWEFPSREGVLSLSGLRRLLRQWEAFGGDYGLPEDRQTEDMEIELLGKGNHIFSHVEWHMLGYLVHLDRQPKIGMSGEDIVWATVEEMEESYSIPSAYKCYYQKIVSSDSSGLRGGESE